MLKFKKWKQENAKKRVSLLLVVTLLFGSISPLSAEEDQNKDELAFKDIKGHWAEEVIGKHKKSGLLAGYPDGTFKPDQSMNRAELITLINRYFGLSKKSEENYEDISEDLWYADETSTAMYYGYMDGSLVNGEAFASREDVIEMVMMLVDLEEATQLDPAKDFSDLANAKESVKKFAELGYMKGYKDGTFKPNGLVSRAEILSIVENKRQSDFVVEQLRFQVV